MSKNRIKLNAPVIRSRAEMESLVGEIAQLMLTRNKQQTEMDAAITEIRSRYEDTLGQITKDLGEKTEVARAWAEAHPEDFKGLKSLEMVHGVIGWRTGQPQLKTLTGWTWDRVLEKLKALGSSWLDYVRVKEEVNKQALLGARETITPEQLRAIGVRVVQEEAFFVEPKIAELATRQTAEGQ